MASRLLYLAAGLALGMTLSKRVASGAPRKAGSALSANDDAAADADDTDDDGPSRAGDDARGG